MDANKYRSPLQQGNFHPLTVFDCGDENGNGPREIATFVRKTDLLRAVRVNNSHDVLVNALKEVVRLSHAARRSKIDVSALAGEVAAKALAATGAA